MDSSIFSQRMKSAMDNKGYKQVDLLKRAEAAGIKLGKSQVSQYVSGDAVPRKNIGEFIANALDVDIDWLYGTDNATKPMKNKNGTDKTNNNIKKNESGDVNMRTFNKSSKLDNVLYDVRGPVVEEANKMEAMGTRVLKLNIGNPAPFDFRTPDEIIYDMSSQLTECEGYSMSKGLFSAERPLCSILRLRIFLMYLLMTFIREMVLVS